MNYKLLAGLLLVCFTLTSVMIPNVLALQDNASTSKVRIFHTPEGDVESRILSPNIADITSSALPSNETGKFVTSSSDDSALPSANNPTATPRIKKSDNGAILADTSLLSTTPWFSIDVWATPSGTQLPSYMSGTFTAVSNTIGGLSGDDVVIYEPMNVAYGSSSSNYVWYQFCIYFHSDGTVDWVIAHAENGNPDNFEFDTVQLTYTPGHSYSFSFTTSGVNTVIFDIQDNTNSATWSNAYYNPEGVTLLHYPNGSFSPASCVEGYTGSSLTNVPTFSTTMGTGQSTYYYEPSNPDWSGRIAQGIGSNVAVVSSTYYWAMVPAKYASSYVDSGPIGYGYPSDSSNLANTPDTHMASIWGPNYHDGGLIFVQLPSSASGNVFIDAYSVSGYYSNTYVYVSPDDVNYYYVGGGIIYPSPECHLWAGTYNGAFNYVAVIGYDEGYSVNLRLDAVAVL